MDVSTGKWILLTLTILLLQSTVAMAQDSWIVLPESAAKKVRVPKFDIGTEWRQDINYNDNGWQTVEGLPGGIGYENESGYENLISLDVGFDMHESGGNPNTGCYVRIKFNLTQEDLDSIDVFTLRVRYDDGFAAYLNGERVAEANAPEQPAFHSAATAGHEANGQENFTIEDAVSVLNVGDNLLAVHAFNVNLTSSDFLINVEAIAKKNPFQNFEYSNLPVVYINTGGKAIPDNPKIDARMGIIYHGVGETHQLNESFNDYDGNIGIEVRGSSSRSWPKQQYAIETRDATGANNNVSLMGLPAENDWILNAPFIDRSFLRNVLAYDLFRRMGRYASRTRYCELFLNGEYRGIYILMEKIKRDRNRVDIAALDSTEIEGEPLTGGYIIKVDKTDGDNTEGFFSKHLPAGDSNRNVYYQYHYPVFADLLPEQRDYIQNYMANFENVMAGSDYDDPTMGYPAWLNVESFIDFFLVSELGKNVDSYRLSSYLHKDRDGNDSRLHAGPLWDYNLAFGLADYYDGTDTDDWMLETLLYIGGGDFQVPFWWETLLQDPQFNYKIKQRWSELRSDVFNINRIHQFIDATADTLGEAQSRNFALWPAPGERGTGFWPMPNVFYSFQSYQDEVGYLKSWIAERIAWMDEHVLLFSAVDSKDALAPASFKLYQNFPNPFNPATTITFEMDIAAHILVEVYNLSGRRIRALASGPKSVGKHALSWDGADESGAPVASGVYAVRATVQQANGRHATSRKMLLLR